MQNITVTTRKEYIMFTVNITHTNKNPDTIFNKLWEKLGRMPTNKEACDEVKRILREVRL